MNYLTRYTPDHTCLNNQSTFVPKRLMSGLLEPLVPLY